MLRRITSKGKLGTAVDAVIDVAIAAKKVVRYYERFYQVIQR